MKIDDMRKLTSMEWNRSEENHRRVLKQLENMGINPGNFYQELEMSGRFVNTHRDVSYSNSTVNLHSHNYGEIIYCRTSCNVEYLIGSNRYRLQKGDIIFVPPGVSHRPILPEKMPEPYERDVIWVSQEFMEMIRKLFPDESGKQGSYTVPIRTAGTRWEFLGDAFRAGVIEEEQKKTGWEIAVLGNTMSIFANMKRSLTDRTAATMEAEKPELLDRVTAYIENHYREHITVSELAKMYFVSDSTISHLFKQKMGISLYRYITQRRLIAAKLLIGENHPLEEVAHRVGFADYSTFYRAFRHEYGISPRQFGQLK